MAQQIGSAAVAPTQVSMQPAVDMSWVQSLDNVVFSQSKRKVISQSSGITSSSIRAECPLVNSAGDTILQLSFESNDRRMRQFSAQLRSVDGKTVHAEFARPAMEAKASNMVFGSLTNNTKPCQVSVGGSHYAATTGSEIMNNLCMQKADSAVGVKMGQGPGCICCCAVKQNLDDLAGQTVAVVTVDNGSGCPCVPNTMQRRTLPLPSEQTAKLDTLLLNVCIVVGFETVAPSSGGG